MKKRLITLFTGILGGGGAERVMATLANEFNRAGFEVDLVLVNQAGSYLNDLDPGINVVNLASRRTLYSLLPLIRYLRKRRPEVLFSTMGYMNIIAILARVFSGVSSRLFVREAVTVSVSAKNTGDFKEKFIMFMLKYFYAVSDGVITPCQGVAEDLIRVVGVSKKLVTVIPNPLDLKAIRERSITPLDHLRINSNDMPLILGVGRLTAQKDFQTLISAFDKVAKVYRVRLIILGEGEERNALEELIELKGIKGLVEMPGYIENPFVYMKQAAVYVLSSRWEGLPNTLLQAAAAGTCIVATDCPSGPKEILEQGRWGKLVPVGDVDAMAKAIIDALEGRLKKIPAFILEERYGIQAITKKYLDTFSVAYPGKQAVSGMESPLKILHVITSLSTGGSEMMLCKLLANINKQRFANSVVSLIQPGKVGDMISKLDIPVDSLGMRRSSYNLNALLKLIGLIRQTKPDIIQTWLYHSDLLGLIAGKISKTGKVIWNIRCSNVELEHYERLTGWTIRICAFLSKFPDAVITNSYKAKSFHLSLGYQPRIFEVIPNGFDLNYFQPDEAAKAAVRQELSISIDAIVVGLVARFDQMKGYQTFCSAAGIVHKLEPKARFVLCGNGVTVNNVQLVSWIKENKIEEVTHLIGERSDIQRIFAALDIYVSSSYGESFSNTIGEAMACGLPCVVTDVGDSARVVGDTGMVVPPKNPQALADSILHLLTMDKQKKRELGIAARQRINSLFSIDNIARQYEDLYSNLYGKF